MPLSVVIGGRAWWQVIRASGPLTSSVGCCRTAEADSGRGRMRVHPLSDACAVAMIATHHFPACGVSRDGIQQARCA
ncbi:hypothetical protein [Streptomyces sp. NPDC001601]|uniref:hypothetical protein n=1 Tax=Streptomyces sp. NPDC001601 TaxID=3364592 RepID=UPI0036C58C12